MSRLGPVIKVAALAVVAALFAAGVVITYGKVRFQDTNDYAAQFADVSGLKAGDDVRVAGVTVGAVRDIAIQHDGEALVSFSVQSRTSLMTGSTATVRYKNLVGQRYLEIGEGQGPPTTLPPGGTIPTAHTSPAVDLDQLYNGFSPLFEGLEPDQVNQLSSSLIAVLQGQGGAVNDLLTQVGSLSSTLADRDKVIGQLVDDLNTVLGTANAHSDQVSDLVDQLQQLVSGLAQDRRPIGEAITKFGDVAGSVDRLLAQARPDLAADVSQIRRLSGLINSDSDQLDLLLQRVPGHYQILGRVGAYQSSFQFYLCGVQVRLEVPGAPPVMSDTIASQEERCQF